MSGDWENRVTALETELRLHVAGCDRRAEEMISRQAAMDTKLDAILAMINQGIGGKKLLFWLGGAVLGLVAIFGHPWDWKIWGMFK